MPGISSRETWKGMSIPSLCFSMSSLGRLYSAGISVRQEDKDGSNAYFRPCIDDKFGHFLCDSPG